MAKFNKHNTLAKCRVCGKLTHSSIDGNLDIELCRECYDDAGDENEHNDTHDGNVEGCKYCDAAKARQANK